MVVLAIARKVWLRFIVEVDTAQLLPLVVAAGGAGAGAGADVLACWLGVDDRRGVVAWEGTVTVTVCSWPLAGWAKACGASARASAAASG